MQKFLTGPQVLTRYQISNMTLHRWEKNPEMDFPKPMKNGRRKFYLEDDLVNWERRRGVGLTVAVA